MTKSTLSGLAWQYTSVFTQALLQLAVLALLARLLSPEDFGLLGIAMIFVGFAALFSQLGVGPAIIQRSELTTTHIRVGFTLSILLSLALTLILWIITPIAVRFFHNDKLLTVLPVVSLNFFFAGFGVVAASLLRRKLQFNRLMWAEVGSYVLGYALVGITLAWMDYGVWALVGATLAQSALKSGFLLLSQHHPLRPSLSRPELRELIHFGGGFTLARMFNYGATQGDYIVVGRVLGSADLGLYTRAYQLMMLPGRYFGQVLNTVLFPVMARIQKDRRRLTKTYLTGVASVSIVCAPIGVLMVIMAPEIVRLLLGPKWSGVVIPFQLLAIGVLPRVSYKLDDALARALGAMYRRSVRDATYAAAVILGSLLGLRWGLPGVAVGVLAAVLLNYLLAVRMSLGLLSCSWSEYARTQAPGAFLTLVVLVEALSIRTILYANGYPAWFILTTVVLISAASIVGLFLIYPRIFGVYGVDAFSTIVSLMPQQRFAGTFSKWLQARTNNV
ncbi:MAG: lipopolysaccharide biosynthesis protein [Candidatus Promineifilaceae bacterium]|nr:lipopolysaccharide biosynthesis protein [Candidatus Promineifilaceae bacterium]